MKLFRNIVLSLVASAAFGSSAFSAKLPTTYPPVSISTAVPSVASGYWRTAIFPGFEVALVAGRYFVVGTNGSTCGATLRVDVAVPKQAPTSASFYGKGHIFNSNAVPVGFGIPMNLIGPYKPGLVGVLTVDGYDVVSDTLTVTISNAGAGSPNGTYVLYRDALSPALLPANPC